jgi:proteasome accessory factor A
VDARFLHGLETEYSFTQFAEGGEVLDRRAGLHGLFLMARKRLESLPDASSSGLFLGNGSRFYLDAGNHPELCTPECTDPWQLVRYLKAGEASLMDLAKELDKPQLGVKLMRTAFFRSNVDYFTRATWGCHESYQYRSRASAMSHELVPHLVSRIVYTGAGGFDDRSPGLEFLVSPRVAHLERVSSDDSTAARGIFHTKDEPLSRGGWHRLHVLCGESLCGEGGSAGDEREQGQNEGKTERLRVHRGLL